MYEFHFDYIKNKYGNNSRLLFTDTDSLMYEIKTEDVSEDFSKDKEMLDFSNYLTKGGGDRFFTGAMKYFRHMLMSHEIFLRIFDRPRKLFLCSLFLIFLVIYFKNLWGLINTKCSN